MKTNKILYVDDEQNALDAITRLLRKTFTIDCAQSGAEALKKLESDGPYAVVLSDLQMPEMNGIELLRCVKKKDPDIVRIMLTGDADLKTAIEAVNTGQVFRFLTKPCSPKNLATTLTLALRQFELIKAEKELLNKTLKGTVTMLSELLSIANPLAFRRATRVRQIAKDIALDLGIKSSWQLEVAALLSYTGYIAVPKDILNKVFAGEQLTEQEREIYNDHPRIGSDLVKKIPRLEYVAELIKRQGTTEQEAHINEGNTAPDIASILKAVLNYDLLIISGKNHEQALATMFIEPQNYNLDVLASLASTEADDDNQNQVQHLHFDDVVPGMVAAEDVYATSGALVIMKNQEITWPLLQGLQNYIDHIGIDGPIQVWNSTTSKDQADKNDHSDVTASNPPFKTCPMCGESWQARKHFLDDTTLVLNGYQADFEELDLGLFYFTHTVEHCGSTLALYAKYFLDLYKGEKYHERRTGKEDCPGYCLDKDQLSRCDAHCECAFVREVADIIKNR